MTALGDVLEQVQIVSDDEAEQSDFVVCVPADWPTPFSDNLTTTCHDCGCAVVHRPYAPKRPPKICLNCVTARINGGNG